MSGKFEGINTLFKCVSISKMLRASRLHKIIECISIPEWIEDCFFLIIVVVQNDQGLKALLHVLVHPGLYFLNDESLKTSCCSETCLDP